MRLRSVLVNWATGVALLLASSNGWAQPRVVVPTVPVVPIAPCPVPIGPGGIPVGPIHGPLPLPTPVQPLPTPVAVPTPVPAPAAGTGSVGTVPVPPTARTNPPVIPYHRDDRLPDSEKWKSVQRTLDDLERQRKEMDRWAESVKSVQVPEVPPPLPPLPPVTPPIQTSNRAAEGIPTHWIIGVVILLLIGFGVGRATRRR